MRKISFLLHLPGKTVIVLPQNAAFHHSLPDFIKYGGI